MRYLVIALVALAAGIAAGALAANALNKRTAYPRAVMTLMQSNLMALRRATDEKRCATEVVMPALSRLHAVGGEIDAAFLAADADEPRFRQLSEEFRNVVAVQIDAAPTDCALLETARAAIGEACKACHQVYRN